jgi:hypothetical protein
MRVGVYNFPMELRRHPGMNYHGINNWPPVWIHSRGGSYASVNGEVGILKFVYASNGISNKCYLVMEHDATHYVGCLIFKDATLCFQVAKMLRGQVGRSIRELGELDLSNLL